MAIQELADVGEAVDLPRMHCAMNEPKVRDAPVCDGERRDGGEKRPAVKVRIEGQRTPIENGSIHRNDSRRPEVAENDFNKCSTDGSNCGEEGIVLDLVSNLFSNHSPETC